MYRRTESNDGSNPLYNLFFTRRGLQGIAASVLGTAGVRTAVAPYVHNPGAAAFERRFLRGEMPTHNLTANEKAEIARKRRAAQLRLANTLARNNTVNVLRGISSHAPAATRGFNPPGSGQTEIKSCDMPNFALASTTTTTTAGTLLNLIKTGSSNYQRVGRKVFMRSIYLRGELEFSSPSEQKRGHYRLLVVYDSQTNGAAPTWADVIQAVDNAGGTTSEVWDGLNLGNRDRFRVLIDKDWAISGTTDFGTPGVPFSVLNAGDSTIVEFRSLKGMETVYGADAGALGDIKSGAIWCWFFGSQAGEVRVQIGCRIRYTD